MSCLWSEGVSGRGRSLLRGVVMMSVLICGTFRYVSTLKDAVRDGDLHEWGDCLPGSYVVVLSTEVGRVDL